MTIVNRACAISSGGLATRKAIAFRSAAMFDMWNIYAVKIPTIPKDSKFFGYSEISNLESGFKKLRFAGYVWTEGGSEISVFPTGGKRAGNFAT